METVSTSQRTAAPQTNETATAPRSYEDLREWLEIVDSAGELKKLRGANWNLEIGTLAELIARERQGTPPALLFDEIPDYPAGARILFGQYCSFRRLALTLGLPLESTGLDLVDRFRKKLSSLKPIPPRVVKTGPVLENRLAGDDDVDLYKFPVPFIHELDGGRFIGTACAAMAMIACCASWPIKPSLVNEGTLDS